MITEQSDPLTTHLRFRPFDKKDAPEVSRLAGDPAISAFTIDIPHPYVGENSQGLDTWSNGRQV